MEEPEDVISYVITDRIELNLSYMPFITNGGLFIPTPRKFALNDYINVDLQLPGKTEVLRIPGKIVWITPANALHHVIPGVGIQFNGPNAQTTKTQIESNLDNTMEVGGYTYGILAEAQKK